MLKARRKYKYLFWIWFFVILIITGFPSNYIPKPIGFLSLLSLDKIVHIFLFSPFAYLLLRFKYQTVEFNKKREYLLTGFYGIIYAFITELLQFYVFIGRSGNIYDFIADIIGVIIGVLIFNYFVNRKLPIKN